MHQNNIIMHVVLKKDCKKNVCPSDEINQNETPARLPREELQDLLFRREMRPPFSPDECMHLGTGLLYWQASESCSCSVVADFPPRNQSYMQLHELESPHWPSTSEAAGSPSLDRCQWLSAIRS